MSEALLSLLLADLAKQATEIGGPTDRMVPRYLALGQEKANWCWAAVGSEVYNFHVRPSPPISQANFASRFGETIGNVAQDVERVFETLESEGQVPRHERVEGAKLLDHETVWSLLETAILVKKMPVPIGVAWEGGSIGHMVCVLGLSSVDGEDAVIVYDPSETDAFPKNLRRIKFKSPKYSNFYRGSPETSIASAETPNNDDLERFDGYLTIAFVP
ncbi:MAG: papain-like cysteine protease family protein [Pseudomonadota bacterium]